MSCCNAQNIIETVSQRFNSFIDSNPTIKLKFDCEYNFTNVHNQHVISNIINKTVEIKSSFKCENNITKDYEYKNI